MTIQLFAFGPIGNGGHHFIGTYASREEVSAAIREYGAQGEFQFLGNQPTTATGS